jgi:hypothetical protein
MGSRESGAAASTLGPALHTPAVYLGPLMSLMKPQDGLKSACLTHGLLPGVHEVSVTLQWKQTTSSPVPDNQSHLFTVLLP